MNKRVDLSQLAVKRDGQTSRRSIVPKRRWISRYVLPLTILFGFTGLIGWAAKDSLLPSVPVKVVPVVVSKAESQVAGTPLFQAAGWIEPRPMPTVVSSMAPGMIEDLLVVEGQSVKKGEPLARLLDTDAKIQLSEAEAERSLREADVESAQAELDSARLSMDNPVKLRAALATAEATLAGLQVELNDLPLALTAARKNLELAEKNVDSKRRAESSLTGPEIRDAESQLADALANVRQMEVREPVLQRQKEAMERTTNALTEQLDLKLDLRSRYNSSRAALKSAQARLQRAELGVQTAELQFQRMEITSPIEGRVHSIHATAGMRVVGIDPHSEKGSSAVATLYDPRMMQVRVDVRLEDIGKVQASQGVQIETASMSNPFSGKVTSVTSVADIQKNTLQVKVAIDNPPELIRPEMLAQVTFFAPENKVSSGKTDDQLRLLIPRELVKNGSSGSFVWVADQATSLARRANVTQGNAGTDVLIEILQGLEPTDKLITAGSDGLEDGQRIRITGEDSRLGSFADDSR